MENKFTGVRLLPSGFWGVFVSGQYIDISSTTMEEAEEKLKKFLEDCHSK